MQAALYFPHTEIKSANLMRSALMTWDSIDCICPKNYTPQYKHALHKRAMEVVGRIRVPTEDEQWAVHEKIEDLLAGGVPETFYYTPALMTGDPIDYEKRVYELWPDKLGDLTWTRLTQAGLVGNVLDNGDYPASRAAGLTLMALLADVMAGETRARITDQGRAYATIANVSKAPTPAHAPPEAQQRIDGQEFDRVVALTLKIPNLSRVPLKRLIAFREREEGRNGHQYRALRHAYLKVIEDHVKRIATMAPTSADRALEDEQFRTKALDSLRDLKVELGFARNAAIFAKDIVVLGLAGAGAGMGAGVAIGASIPIPAAVTLGGLPATLGGVLSAANKFAQDRRATLRKYPLAYLYELDRRLV